MRVPTFASYVLQEKQVKRDKLFVVIVRLHKHGKMVYVITANLVVIRFSMGSRVNLAFQVNLKGIT
jgi:hypothetical protein